MRSDNSSHWSGRPAVRIFSEVPNARYISRGIGNFQKPQVRDLQSAVTIWR
jgi:hypothetical protein